MKILRLQAVNKRSKKKKWRENEHFSYYFNNLICSDLLNSCTLSGLYSSRNFHLGPQCLGVGKWSAVMRNDSGRALVVLQILEKIVIQLSWLTIAPFFWVVSFCFLFTRVFFVVKLLLCAVCWNGCVALCTPSVMSSLVGILKFTCLPCSFKKFESYSISLIHKLKQGLSFSQILSTQTAASLDPPVLYFCCFNGALNFGWSLQEFLHC